MKVRGPGFFTLVSIIGLMLCLLFAVAWIKSRHVSTAAVSSTYFVQAQLARPVTMDLQNVSLPDAIDFLRSVMREDITVDWAALESGGVICDGAISQNFSNLTAGEVLQKVLEQAGPGTQFVADETGIHVTMQAMPWREELPPPKLSEGAIRDFALQKRRSIQKPPRPAPITERVVGAKRYTLVLDQGLLRLWITPRDPGAVYQDRGRIGSGANEVNFERLGITIKRIGSPINTWEIALPFWLLIALSASCPLLWLVTASRRRRRRRRQRQLCIDCGYDLRATPQQCPECGRVVASAEAAATALPAS
nr:Unknown Function [uncultured bacterium]